MNQQSNDNFDRLFRKVANKYPLNTNNKNWDIVAARLNEQKLIAQKLNKKRQLAALLLLLISIGSFGIYFYTNTSIEIKKVSQKTSVKISPKQQQQSQQNITSLNNSNKIKNDFAVESIQPKSSIQQKTFNGISLSQTEKNYNGNSFLNESNSVLHQTQSFENALQPSFKNINDYQLAEIAKSNSKNNPGFILKHLNQNGQQFLFQQNQSVQENNINKQKKSTHLKLNSRPTTFLYGSFFVSPDFSTVRFQKINTPGLKIGVQLGYRISNSFSAEINLIRYHSDFYSLGKYFSAANLKLKPNTVVEKIYGKTKMTEVPFDIRYNFPKINNHFFVTAGTSLALITHTENYNYDVMRGNGVNASASKKFNSVTGTKYFSNINLSAGYEAPLLYSIKIKAEPYYQIPVKKFGIGSLPVTHFGVNIGIVKDLK